MYKLLIACTLLVSAMATNAQKSLHNTEGYTLKQTYQGYLQAIKARDYHAVVSYFTESNTLPFISGGGEFNSDFEKHLQSQKEWLSDSTWTYESEIKSFQEFENAGVIIENVQLHFNNNNEKWTYNMMVTYVFIKENNMWRMVTDVCTGIL